MRDYYEELWQSVPEEPAPADFALRREFLLSELRPGEKALDLGCGAGDFTAEVARAGVEVIGMDVAEAALARARARHPRLDFRLTPIEGPLSLEDNGLDLVWASEVIEHVADTARWLSEARRVLRPGGRLLLTTPSHGRVRLALHGIERFSEPLGDHLHLYTRKSLRQLLHEFDFDPVEVRPAGGPPLMRRMLLARGVRASLTVSRSRTTA